MKTNIQYRISFFRFAMSLACTLFLATIYLQVSDTHAMSHLSRLRCDYIFSEHAFTEVDRADYPECVSRFDYLTKRYFTNNYR